MVLKNDFVHIAYRRDRHTYLKYILYINDNTYRSLKKADHEVI